MASGKLVRISSDTMDQLVKIAKPFESPNECIHRLLSKNPCNTEDVKKGEDDE